MGAKNNEVKNIIMFYMTMKKIMKTKEIKKLKEKKN